MSNPNTISNSKIKLIKRYPHSEKMNGYDWLNSYEFSWLDQKTGWPQLKLISIIIPYQTNFYFDIISLKKYLLSFRDQKTNEDEVIFYIESHLSNCIEHKVQVHLTDFSEEACSTIWNLPQGINLDLGYGIYDCFEYNKDFLINSLINYDEIRFHKAFSQSFSFMSPLDHMPLLSTLELSWVGSGLIWENLSKYLVSFRDSSFLMEQGIETIYSDLKSILSPSSLSVKGSFTRRHGFDLNISRSFHSETPCFKRYPGH